MSDCNDRDSFTVTMDASINAIKHLKPGKSHVSTVYLLIILSTVLHYYLNIYLAYLYVCYLIVLYPLHFQSLLWSYSKGIQQRFNIFSLCLDAYGSQLWNFDSKWLNRIMFHGVRWFGYYGIAHALLIVIFCQLLILLYLWISL